MSKNSSIKIDGANDNNKQFLIIIYTTKLTINHLKHILILLFEQKILKA